MLKPLLALAVLVVVAGCASTGDEAGWTGSGAQPFDAAFAECQAETRATHGAAFDLCMAGKGWTRPTR